MTPQERTAWNKHLQEYPFGDFHAQRLLAILCSMVASIGGGKAVKASDFAPWLQWEQNKPIPFAETLEGKAMDAIIEQTQKARKEQQNG